jgi:ribosome-associated protein
LRAERIASLALPATLEAAIAEAKRLTTFGAKRRQSQFIGKLMRRLDAETLAAVRSALGEAPGRSAADTKLLHRAERWRALLLADATQIVQWLEAFPGTDAKRLRALIRQASRDARDVKTGEAVRQGRAYREIFLLVRAQLSAAVEQRLADR